MDIFKSKKFWMTVVGFVVPGANSLFGWGLVVEEIAPMVAPFAAYVVGQGMADFGKHRAS